MFRIKHRVSSTSIATGDFVHPSFRITALIGQLHPYYPSHSSLMMFSPQVNNLRTLLPCPPTNKFNFYVLDSSEAQQKMMFLLNKHTLHILSRQQIPRFSHVFHPRTSEYMIGWKLIQGCCSVLHDGHLSCLLNANMRTK